MKYLCSCLVILTVAVFLGGCGHISPRGLIYTHTRKPLDVNLTETPSALNHAKANIRHLQYQFYVDLRWGSNSVGDIARQNGFETVYFADMEKLSILGIWKQYTVHIYGK